MYVTESVNIPDELERQLRRDRLVLFVGAGVSVPSGLPSFFGLATELAGQSGHLPPTKKDADRLDYFIGRLSDDHFNAHEITKKIFQEKQPTANSEHAAIMALATACKTPRIITTNYDNLLAEAADEKGFDYGEQYFAPALPLGRDFKGLVHLHGSLLKPSKNMVLDDRDFGKAYFTDGWATRFLTEVFANYTVLFIGYSVNDPVIRYLSLGMHSNGPHHFIFLGHDNKSENKDEESYEDSLANFKHLQFETIEYPVQNGNHQALIDALSAWTELETQSVPDHIRKTQELVEAGIPQTQYDTDSLLNELSAPSGLDTFTQKAKEPTWINWLYEQKRYSTLFDGTEPQTFPQRQLLNWVIRICDINANSENITLQYIKLCQQRLSDYAFRSFSTSAIQPSSDGTPKKALQAFLSTSIQDKTMPYMPHDSLLCGFEDQFHASNIVWEAALRPFLEFDRSPKFYKPDPLPFSSDEKPDVNVSWNIPSSFERGTTDDLATRCEHSPSFEMTIENSLNQAMNLLSEYYSDLNHEHWDAFTHARIPKIEACENTRSDLRLIVDTLRTFGEQHDKKDELANRWIQSNQIVLRRLAIHEQEINEASPDEKLKWLLKQNLLLDRFCEHEVRQFFKTVIKHVSAAQKASLLEKLQPPYSPEDIPNRTKAMNKDERQRLILLYELFARVCWLSSADPNWHEIQQLQSLYEKDFGFVPDPDSDVPLKIYHSVKGQISLEEFTSLVKQSPSKAISEILSLPKEVDTFDSFSFEAGCRLIGQYCSGHPQDACNLWDATLSAPDTTEYERTQIVLFITNEIRNADFKNDVCNITQRICTFDWNEADLYSPIFFVIEQINRIEPENAESFFQTTQHFIDSLIPKYGQVFHAKKPNINQSGYVACNLWPALIMKYQIKRVIHRYKVTPQVNWNGMSTDERNRIQELLNTSSNLVWPMQITCAQKLSELFILDKGFAREHIMPLFHDESTQHQTWVAFLAFPRITNSFSEEDVSDLLKDQIAEARYLCEYKDQGLRNNYWDVLFNFMNMLPNASNAYDAALKKVLCNSGFSTLLEIAKFLPYWCHKQNDEQIDIAWEKWLKTYVNNRFQGIPRNLEPEEQKALICLIPSLRGHISEALEILSTSDNIDIDFSQDRYPVPEGYDEKEQQQLLLFYQWQVKHQTSECDSFSLKWWLHRILRELTDEYPNLDLTALRETMQDQFGFTGIAGID